MIGASNILVFRDAQFKSLVQCIAHRDLQVPPAPVEGAQAQALTLRWDKTRCDTPASGTLPEQYA